MFEILYLVLGVSTPSCFQQSNGFQCGDQRHIKFYFSQGIFFQNEPETILIQYYFNKYIFTRQVYHLQLPILIFILLTFEYNFNRR